MANRCPGKGPSLRSSEEGYVLKIAAHKAVTVEIETTDRYGRTVGEIFLPDGRNLNNKIVGAGYAWQHKRYSKDPSTAN